MLPSLHRLRGLQTPGKPDWICTFLWILFIALIGFGSVSCTSCTYKDLMTLQTPCRAENDDLVTHIGTNHTQKLCSSLHNLWFCVARNVPRCFHNITDIYEHLTHSPHNCQLGTDEFKRIQKIVNENDKKDGSSTTTITQTQQTTTGKNGDGDDEGYVVNGNNSGQKGNTGSSSRNCDHVTRLLLILLTLVHTFPVFLPVL